MVDKFSLCPCCGIVVNNESEREQIEIDMESDLKSCVHCLRTFREAREEVNADYKDS